MSCSMLKHSGDTCHIVKANDVFQVVYDVPVTGFKGLHQQLLPTAESVAIKTRTPCILWARVHVEALLLEWQIRSCGTVNPAVETHWGRWLWAHACASHYSTVYLHALWYPIAPNLCSRSSNKILTSMYTQQSHVCSTLNRCLHPNITLSSQTVTWGLSRWSAQDSP